jgi:hypothetical protein
VFDLCWQIPEKVLVLNILDSLVDPRHQTLSHLASLPCPGPSQF